MANEIYLVCFKGSSIEKSIFDRLIRIFTKHKYTHVGLTTDISGDNITYYAARYDAGVREYTESKEDVDTYLIHLKNDVGIKEFFEKTEGNDGSFVKDINHPELANMPRRMVLDNYSPQHYWRHPDISENGWGTVEWVACALGLAMPFRYTIDKLIEFANLE